EQDYANGYAYSAQGWVVIYLHGAEFELRGTTRWLPGVLAHEIGHIFTLRKMGDDSHFLGLDVFHDWSGKGITHSQTGIEWTFGRTPPWLAEGLAQFAANICGYDTLDTHRQMVLRVAAASGTLMTLAELKGFAWDARRNEMLYTQGFSLVSHLYTTYGPKATNRYLALAASRGWRGAFRPAFGKKLEAIYADWRKGLESRYRPDDAASDGEYLLPQPAGSYQVETSPAPLRDGRFLYLSSRHNDFGQTDLYLTKGKEKSKRLFRDVTSVEAAEDGRSALFTATQYAFRQGQPISELYRYDDESGAIERLTTAGRVIRGCENRGIAYAIRNNEGRTSVIRIANGEFTTLFTPPDSIELTDVVAGPGPGALTLVGTSGFGGDLYELDIASREISTLADSPQDERDPRWSGSTLYFSADYGGAYDVYALADEQISRITHVSGGAFHPVLSGEYVWFSAYGSQGFRLARAKSLGESAPPFIVELPVPAWKPSLLAEYEADTYDHTNLGFLGYAISLGVVRSPGFRDTRTDTSGTHEYSFRSGNRAVTAVTGYWQNPTGVTAADIRLGWSTPIDYHGPMHFDQSAFEFRVDAFLPTIVLGGSWDTYDFPEVRYDGNAYTSYQASANGYAGLDLRLGEHWFSSLRGAVEDDFEFVDFGGNETHTFDSDPQFGGFLELDYAAVDQGVDGPVRGFSAYAKGGIPPKMNAATPDYSFDGGGTLYSSLNRFLFASASLYHAEDWGTAVKKWIYGGASAYCAIPLGLQLGTRGGAGLFLAKAYPGIAYLGMARQSQDQGEPASDLSGSGLSASGLKDAIGGRFRAREWNRSSGAEAFSPQSRVFSDISRYGLSREIGFTLKLKTLSFFNNPELWAAGIWFDAEDFGRDPAWTLTLTL
ncbi:MAG: hypothetical protein ABI036_18025, partial [Fibrobacteria bacterium]